MPGRGALRSSKMTRSAPHQTRMTLKRFRTLAQSSVPVDVLASSYFMFVENEKVLYSAANDIPQREENILELLPFATPEEARVCADVLDAVLQSGDERDSEPDEDRHDHEELNGQTSSDSSEAIDCSDDSEASQLSVHLRTNEPEVGSSGGADAKSPVRRGVERIADRASHNALHVGILLLVVAVLRRSAIVNVASNNNMSSVAAPNGNNGGISTARITQPQPASATSSRTGAKGTATGANVAENAAVKMGMGTIFGIAGRRVRHDDSTCAERVAALEAHFRRTVVDHRNAMAAAKAGHDATKKRLEAAQAEAYAQSARVKSLVASALNSTAQSRQLRSQVDHLLHQQKEAGRQAHTACRKQCATEAEKLLERQSGEHKKEVVALQTEFKRAMQKRQMAYERSLEQAEGRHNAKVKHMNATNQRILMEQAKANKKASSGGTRALDACEKDLKAARTTCMRELKHRTKTLGKANVTCVQELHATERKLEALNATCVRELNETMKNMEAMNITCLTQIARLNARAREVEGEIEAFVENLNTARDARERLQETVKENIVRIDKLKSLNSELELKLSNVVEQRKLAHAKSESLLALLDERTRALATAAKNATDLVGQVNALRAQRNRARSVNRMIRAEILENTSQLAAVVKNSSLCAEQVATLKQQSNNARKAQVSLQKKLEESKDNFVAAAREIEVLNQAHDQCKSDATIAEERHELCTTKLQESRASHNETQRMLMARLETESKSLAKAEAAREAAMNKVETETQALAMAEAARQAVEAKAAAEVANLQALLHSNITALKQQTSARAQCDEDLVHCGRECTQKVAKVAATAQVQLAQTHAEHGLEMSQMRDRVAELTKTAEQALKDGQEAVAQVQRDTAKYEQAREERLWIRLAASAAQVRSAERRKCENEMAQRMQNRSSARNDLRVWFAFSLVFLASLVTAGSSSVASTELGSMAGGPCLSHYHLHESAGPIDAQRFGAGEILSAGQVPSPVSLVSPTPSLSKLRTSTPQSDAAETPVIIARSPAASGMSESLRKPFASDPRIHTTGARMRSNVLRSTNTMAVSPSPRPPPIGAVIMHLQRSISQAGNSTMSNQGDQGDDIF